MFLSIKFRKCNITYPHTHNSAIIESILWYALSDVVILGLFWQNIAQTLVNDSENFHPILLMSKTTDFSNAVFDTLYKAIHEGIWRHCSSQTPWCELVSQTLFVIMHKILPKYSLNHNLIGTIYRRLLSEPTILFSTQTEPLVFEKNPVNRVHFSTSNRKLTIQIHTFLALWKTHQCTFANSTRPKNDQLILPHIAGLIEHQKPTLLSDDSDL